MRATASIVVMTLGITTSVGARVSSDPSPRQSVTPSRLVTFTSGDCDSSTSEDGWCEYDILMFDTRTQETAELTTIDGFDEAEPGLSGDGSRLTYASWPTPYGTNSTIWVADADGSAALPITGHAGPWDEWPTWSPIDDRIVFTRWNERVWSGFLGEGVHGDLYVTEEAAPNVWIESILISQVGTEDHAAFSSDGSAIAYRFDADDDGIFDEGEDINGDIWVAKADGSSPKQLTDAPTDEAHPAWSPDGRRIVFSVGPEGGVFLDGPRNLWLMRADGSGWKRLTTGRYVDLAPNWSPDGRLIVFQRCPDPVGSEYWYGMDCAIALVTVANPQKVKLLFDTPGAFDGMPRWVPTGN